MKRVIASMSVESIMLSAGCAGTKSAAGSPAPKAAGVATTFTESGPGIERFVRIRTPGSPSVAPDGTMYVRDLPDGVFQLYRVKGDSVKADFKGEKLTNYKDGLAGFSMWDDGSKILLLHAFGGNENTQVSLLDTASGSITELLANPKVQHGLNHWLDDGSGFVYTANDESPNDFYIYRHDFGTGGGKGKTTKLLGKEGSWSLADMTKDGTRAIVSQYRSASDSTIQELTTAGSVLTDLTVLPSGGGTVSVEAVGYMPDERSVVYVSDIEGGLKKVFVRDLTTGAISKPLPALDGVHVDGASINRERTLMAVVTNEDGYGVPHLYRLPSFEPVKLPAIERGVVSLSSLRGNKVQWTQSNARTPGLTYAWTVPGPGEAAGPVRQLTFADTQGIDLNAFPLPELIRYKAFDGLSVPAFLYTPAGYKKGTPIPFVVNYHGGPEGQFRPVFDRTVQYLLSEGFGVLQPNVRGSDGYGREFLMMDDYKKRWDSVRDGVDAAAWLVASGYAVPGRIATYGGSYGGFMSVACIVEDQQRVDAGTQQERLFGAGINVVGIVNVKTFLEQTSGYRRKLREVEYGPLSDPEFLHGISSIHKIDKINVPMMIAHGLNDPRVPVGEAMQLAVGLMKRGMDPVQFYCHDEGHGFQKLDNRLLFSKKLSQFLKSTIAK
jgi:dipeptidyl aminopeptidase/acylaminoacyl peptidase